MLAARHKRLIKKILQFGLIWFVAGIVYSLLERGLLGGADHFQTSGNPYNFKKSITINSISTLLMGMLQGTIEFYFLRNLFIRNSFLKKMFWKTIIYVLTVGLFILCLNSIYNSSILDLPLFSMEIARINFAFIKSFTFWSIIIFVECIIILCLLFSDLSDHIGQNVVGNFFSGKYHKPVTEERIFMFLDMKSSTAIAEKLGHVLYFKLLNIYYFDMTEPILESSGEIYQYAGDNIIVTWDMKTGLQNNNCLNCFFKIKECLKKNAEKYKKQFNLMPEFKAGLHHGKVTTGEIGVLKKEIIFTGDVLNTTDRIQNLCNEYKVDILLSEALLSELELKNKYKAKEIGVCEIKGKVEKVKLFTLWK